MEERIERAASALRDAEQGVAFTGAGLSTASGIPDFRSEDGIWADHDPSQFHIRAFERDPGAFWDRLVSVYDEAFAGDPDPNSAHRALARLEQEGHLSAVITQNGDRLHQEANSAEVIELHGTMHEVVCQSCRYREPFTTARERVASGEFPPECPECNRPLKPAGILFGESLPRHALFRAQALAEQSDVFVVAGSSLSVEPAASLPETAAERGATLVVVNLEPTPLDDQADITFHENVTTVLPRIAETV